MLPAVAVIPEEGINVAAPTVASEEMVVAARINRVEFIHNIRAPPETCCGNGAQRKFAAGEAINAKLSGDSWRFSNEDRGDFIKLQPA
ncbi:MAG: hypothetical protein ACI9UA_001041 [Pseudoalteromonas tetraodonis]